MAVRVYKGGEYRRWDLLGLSCFCGWVYASFFTKAVSYTQQTLPTIFSL